MQFGQAAVQRPARAQCLGRVEMGAGEHQVEVRGRGRDPREVVGEAFAQFHRRVLDKLAVFFNELLDGRVARDRRR